MPVLELRPPEVERREMTAPSSAPVHGRRSPRGPERLLPWMALLVNAIFGLAAALRLSARATTALLDWLFLTTVRVARGTARLAEDTAARVDAALMAVENLLPHLEAIVRGAGRAALFVLDSLAAGALASGRAVGVALQALDRLSEPLHAAAGRRAARIAAWALVAADRACTLALPAVLRVCWRATIRYGPRLAAGTALAAIALVAASGLAVVGLRLAAADVAADLHAAPNHGLPPLAERSVVLAADGTQLATLHGEIDREVVELETVPDHLISAVLTAEDRDFWQHEGYDLRAMARAAMANVRARGIAQGGSTITQQLAKSNHVGDDRTLDRKARELVYALALERLHSKDVLLERYLNEVYFGAGSYGVVAAAEEYFAVGVQELSVEQGALLAGLIRSPSGLDARREPERALTLRNAVLDQMGNAGTLGDEQLATARTAPLGVVEARSAVVHEPFVVAAVQRELLADASLGRTEAERARALLTGGLEIRTTIDPRLQEAARQAVAARAVHSLQPSVALAAVEPATGRVRALHSGHDYDTSQFDLATQGRRQPGSAFKPMVAAAALAGGWPTDGVLPGDAVLTLAQPGGGEWTVTNFDGADHGTVNLEEALVGSVNTAFADLVMRVGVDNVVEVAAAMGIDVDRALGPPGLRGPAIALGGIARGVSPLEMASAYGTFVNGGVHEEPTLVAEITGPDGEPVRADASDPVQALDPAVAGKLSDMLAASVTEGTGTAAQLPGHRPVGKTGTSQHSADAWFVGAVPELSTAVWIGDPRSATPLPGLTGGTAAAPLWRDFMATALGVATR